MRLTAFIIASLRNTVRCSESISLRPSLRARRSAALRMPLRTKSGAVSRRFQASSLRSEEHTSELQSRLHLVCRLLLEKKKKDSLNRDQPDVHQYGHTAHCSD